MKAESFTKYERARILGARALQIAMNAPLLIKINSEELEKLNFDALRIAELEFNSEVLPISIKRPMPEKKESALARAKSAKVIEKKEGENEDEEEKEVSEEGEIMEIANPDDEMDDSGDDDSGGGED